MVAFVAFISYFLILTIVDKKYDHDLVSEDYYNKELEFQHKIDVEKRTIQDGMTPQISIEKENGVIISFPKEQASGMVYFFRPSEKELDFELEITTQDKKMHIPHKLLKKGRWNISVNFYYSGQQYRKDFNIDYK